MHFPLCLLCLQASYGQKFGTLSADLQSIWTNENAAGSAEKDDCWPTTLNNAEGGIFPQPLGAAAQNDADADKPYDPFNSGIWGFSPASFFRKPE